mmetsp:Transcript_8801/g.19739  ORF Transcript_8801/g.19739 Transcript_8801/m.19739 type:complete len:1482 (-) Transcript_8801:451-4896(-)
MTMPTPAAARSAVYSLQREFEYEATANQNNNDNDNDDEAASNNNNSNDGDGDDGYLDHLPIPPPPRDHHDDEDDDDSLLEDHIGHRHRHTNNHDHGNPSLSHSHSNDDDESHMSFGEDTMHILMDAEVRLSAVPPSSSSRCLLSSDQERDHNDVTTTMAMAALATTEAEERQFESEIEQRQLQQLMIDEGGMIVGKVAMPEEGNAMMKMANENDNDSDDDGLSTGLSTGIASLLRGPIMAAKSTISRAEGGMADAGAGGRNMITTPSAARSEFLSSVQKEVPSSSPSPSARWNGFGRNGHSIGNGGIGDSSSDKNMNMIANEVIVSTQKQQPIVAHHSQLQSSQQQQLQSFQLFNSQQQQQRTTPSSERNHFLSSPQDSVSTMGIRSPSDGYDDNNAMYLQQSQRQQACNGGGHPAARGAGVPVATLYPTPSLERNKFVTSPQQYSIHTGTSSMPSSARGRPPTSSSGNGRSKSSQHEHQHEYQQEDASPLSMAKYPSETPLSNRDGSNSSNNNGRRNSDTASPVLEEVNQLIHDIRRNNLHFMDNQSMLLTAHAAGNTTMDGKKNDDRMSTNNASMNALESMIALGERQMKITNAAAPAAAPSTTNTVPTKKPFLRKGARKEPSSLHKMNTTSNFNNADSNKKSSRDNVAVMTPSTQQRVNWHNSTCRAAKNGNNVKTNANTTPSTQQLRNANNNHEKVVQQHGAIKPSTKSTSSQESLSERKARLARLEQMQHDMLKDLERRQARKEEARMDRRNGIMMAKQKKQAAAANDVPLQQQVRSQSTPLSQTPSHRVRRDNTNNDNNNDSREQTLSQFRAARRSSAVQKKSSSAKRGDDAVGNGGCEDAATDPMTPSSLRARGGSGLSSTVGKSSSPSVEIVEEIVHGECNIHMMEYDESLLADEVMLQLQGNDEKVPVDHPVIGKNGTTPKSTSTTKQKVVQQRPKSTPRPRTSSTTRSSSAAKRRHNGKQTTRSSSNDDEITDKKAFEEWKRKEEEQWALIKNMRRRQEAALREAEGERERAKAWATAEKESVQKWASEQRALIKKDRHKAANAALIASRKASEGMRQKENTTAEEEEEHGAIMKAEVEGLHLELKKMRAKLEGGETNKLREQVRRQERIISALKSGAARSGVDGAGVVTSTVVLGKSKGPVNGPCPPRQALGDCSAKQNAQQRMRQHQQSSKPRSIKVRRRSTAEDAPKEKQQSEAVEEYIASDAVVEEEDEETDTHTLTKEEPTEHWLQQHLSKLNNANNRLGSKMVDEEGHALDSNVRKDDHHAVDVDADAGPQFVGKRKPYNAADYGGGNDGNYPTQSLSRPNNNHAEPDGVPPFVTVSSPSMLAEGVAGAAGVGIDDYRQRQQQAQAKSQIFSYKNGTQKEVLPDGTTTISFGNGDRKRTYANEKKGIVVYYYAATKTTQVTHQDGMQTYHFPNKQIENHYPDGKKEITFPDGTKRVHMNGSTDTTFADGVRVIDYPDGTQRVIQA